MSMRNHLIYNLSLHLTLVLFFLLTLLVMCIKLVLIIISSGERMNSKKVKVQWYSRVEDVQQNHVKDIPEGKKHCHNSIIIFSSLSH